MGEAGDQQTTLATVAIACPYCGAAQVRASAKFCGACGKAVPQAAPAPPASMEVTCPACGERLPASARFCGRCGQPIARQAAAPAPEVPRKTLPPPPPAEAAPSWPPPSTRASGLLTAQAPQASADASAQQAVAQAADHSKDFFISYTGVDVEWAIWIAQQLEATGYTTIYQARDFYAGSDFIIQMHQAMRATKRTVAVLTPDYLRARYTQPEWADAVRRDPTGEYALLLPVRVRECAVDGLFGARLYVNLVGLDEAASRDKLLEGARGAVSRQLPPASFPGAASAAARPLVVAPMDLPLPASLIGRDDVLADLMAKLRAGTISGVFALEGMGGVGKTALAAEAVARLAEEVQAFPGGAAWIACEGLEGEAGLAELWTKVARALSLEQIAAQPDPQRRRVMLAAALAQGQRLLLALDNIEPGLDAGAALETLSVRNHTALLLTARQRVAPHLVAAIDLAPLLPDGARALFLERLAQAGGAAPIPAEEPALVALLEAVGGLPLALELTAAYAGVQRLSLESVVREVKDDGLHALAFGNARRDPKRALAKRFERSWAALSAHQQRLFAGLSLLEGNSFPREAAQALAAAAAEDADAPESEDDPRTDLPTLVSYALVEALPGGERLRLHPLMREYAAGKLKLLSPEQQARLGDAMVAFWLEYARAHPGYEGMDALEAEAAGLMGAVQWAHEQAWHQAVLGLARSLGRAWNVRGRRDDQQRMYAWMDEAARQVNDLKEQCWAAHHLGLIYSQVGRLEEARLEYQRALELARKMNSPGDERDEVHALAGLDRDTGRLEEARAGYERALELARQSGDLTAERAEVHGLALLNDDQGRLEEARAGYERALELARQLGDLEAEQLEVHSLAELDRQTKRLEEARAGYERALELARQLGDPAAERREVHGLAVLDDDQGRFSEARAGYERALELARRLRDPAQEAKELQNLGLFLCEHNETERGHGMIEEGLAIYKRLTDVYNIGKCHEFLGWVDRNEGNNAGAIAHQREALRCFEQVQSPDAEAVRARLSNLEIEFAFRPEVVRAVRNLLNTASWPETHAVLEQEQARLLTDEADQFLGALIEQVQQSADPDAQKLADYRAAHRQLLVAARASDVPTAWAWFEQAVINKEQEESAGTSETVRVLRAFLGTSSWAETRAVLEQEQALLLTDDADQLLKAAIEQAQQSDDPEEQKKADLLGAHLQLLRVARASDIPTAWAWFEETFLSNS